MMYDLPKKLGRINYPLTINSAEMISKEEHSLYYLYEGSNYLKLETDIVDIIVPVTGKAKNLEELLRNLKGEEVWVKGTVIEGHPAVKPYVITTKVKFKKRK